MKHQGKEIYIAGKPGEKGCIPFQHTDQYGVTKTLALAMNKTYRVGETDENGELIEDWAYESFLSFDLNNNREKTSTEKRSDLSKVEEGGIRNRVAFIN